MSRFIDWLNEILGDYFNLAIPDISIIDIVEILIIAVFFYEVFAWIKNTRAWMLFRGILFILAFFILAAVLQMHTILWLGERLLSAGLVALVVVFQPELRNALEHIGRGRLFRSIFSIGIGKTITKRFSERTITDLVKASFEMGAAKTGALIVVEKDVKLTEYVRTGIELDSVLTRQLLINIFEKNTPLHDGAVIVREDRVVAATCYLPLTENMELSKELGTRHRAAVGISEVSDALTIVVSEETGKVSVTRDGTLLHDLTPDQLLEEIQSLQTGEVTPRFSWRSQND
ncbi:MAG: diadenylate cyclase CdaA [Lachnospiraceae bacterium]|nr:diadenylate cyclase CdaA [Lachnospiraceae bacterium]